MEKRKWLWKRKSSERSPCESESTGSVSSHSERLSDDQQDAIKGSPNHYTQSLEPEVSSKAVAVTENSDDSSLKSEDINYSVKTLTERLSAALVNVSAKEDLVKQHAKVAEEAVAGWEKAENEVTILKQQLEAAVQQNSSLEDRASHLDGALKECVRQLRQARDEQEQKIQDAVSKKTQEWESTKCQLENELVELKNKAGDNKSSARVDPDLCLKLEILEKENSALNLEIQAQMEELEIRAIERDLSTQAAETASKQHLESIKKVAKLEAECRKLKAIVCKSSLGNDHKSTTASSTYVESFADSHSDNGERLNGVESNTRKLHSFELSKCDLNSSDSWASALIAELDQFKNEKTVNKNLPSSSIEINLMDDFLEMERLAALQPTESSWLESEVVADEPNSNRESVLRTELDAMIQQIAELEEKLQKLETEKAELETALRESQDCIEANRSNNRESVLKTELEAMNQRTTELEDKLVKSEIKQAELEIALTKCEDFADESKYAESVLRSELEAMIHRTAELEEKLEKLEMKKAGLETALIESQDCATKLKHEENNLRTELETMIHRTIELEENLKRLETEKADLETALTKSKHCANESKKGESVLQTELKAMIQRNVELEEQLKKLETEKSDLEIALTKSQDCIEALRLQLIEAEMKMEELKEELNIAKESKEMIETQLISLEAETSTMSEAPRLQIEAEIKLEELKGELNIAKESKQMIETQLISLEAETRTMFAKVKILEEEVQRERALSAEIAIKCQDLEEELSREKDEVQLQQTECSNSELKIKQEDLAVAATKLAECQKTIASLGNQLKSLATLEDFLIDAPNIIVPAGAPLIQKTGQHWKMHSNQTFSPKRDSNSSKAAEESSAPAQSKNHDNPSPPSSSSSSSSTSATVQSTHVSSEKNRNGFAKFFSRTKSGIRLEI
ncbi:filament-like plant protein 1 isoform X1 [Cannabis sativa]|uniref:filament-like plant protein 1 isoform X1 n=1 Tax=Cannabis sativa TaxID=3483 RepID=UPI0029C9E4C7|nr:filament-like plant protein 1 isoform X1 [Cannabis sativa]XP_030485629.2 filament-like plant protein 1 isoform X1 [Cannabis sativa]XP_030485630.2 filament-like plant protein 1 isoform X1 [Cannabis sativa]XP_060961226.1 filament-like plant protein 1 isoform X1 [Cannabis sativa]